MVVSDIPLSPGQRVAQLAEQFVGLVEVEQNKRWDNPLTPGVEGDDDPLRQILSSAGWQPGWPYCMAWCEGVWRLGGAPKEVLRLLNPSVVQSATAMQKYLVKTPSIGSIMLMRLGNTGQGHAGLVVKLHGPLLGTVGLIEANTTSPDGKRGTDKMQREGGGIYRKVRPADVPRSPKGLWTLGYLPAFPSL